MPKPKKHIKASRLNGAEAAAVVAVSDEVREAYQQASPLTLSAPIRFTVGRGASARQMRTLAHKSWQYVCRHFGDVRLDGRAGSYQQPTQDYGGLRSMMDIKPPLEPGQQTGLRFMGTPSYDKKGMSRQREAKSHRPYRELIHAVLQSTAGSCDFQLISPRVGFFYGVDTGWHSDANTRGAHPNALRTLDDGGALRIYKGVDFRCSLLNFREDVILPLDLNPYHFRYIQWDGAGSDGSAYIVTEPAQVFWEEVVAAGPKVIGSTGCCIISMKHGNILTVPLDYRDIRTRDLDLAPFHELLSHAKAHPLTPPADDYEVIGQSPDKWHVFYGWRNAHCWEGNSYVRRVHIIGCPYRQNGSGQNRVVACSEEGLAVPIHPKRAAILALRPGDWISINGSLELAEVFRVEDALHLSDIRVQVRYELIDGDSHFVDEWLGLKDWEVDRVPGMRA